MPLARSGAATLRAPLEDVAGRGTPKDRSAEACGLRTPAIGTCGTEAMAGDAGTGMSLLKSQVVGGAGMAERHDTVGTDGTTGEPTHSFRATLETLGREALGFGPVKEEDGARAIGDPMT